METKKRRDLMDEKETIIARMTVEGRTQSEIARHFNVTDRTVRNWKKSDKYLVCEELARTKVVTENIRRGYPGVSQYLPKRQKCSKCGEVKAVNSKVFDYLKDSLSEICRLCKTRSKNSRKSRKRRSPKIRRNTYVRIADWESALAEFEDSCAYCGAKGRVQKDHFIPILLGGTDFAGNIVPACPSCNGSKGANDPFSWFKNTDFYTKDRELKILSFLLKESWVYRKEA